MRRELPQSAHKHSHRSKRRGHRDATRITKKSGTYYYRRRVPGSGQGEIALSLSTDRFREAEWLASSLEAEFQRLPWRSMSTAEIQHLLHALLDRLLEDDRVRRVELRERGRPVFASRHHIEEHAGDVRGADTAAFADDAQFWRDVLDEGDFDAVSETVDEILEGKEVTEAERRTLAVGVIETFIKAREVSEGRSSGKAFAVLEMTPGPEVPPLPVQPLSVVATTSTEMKPSAPLVSELIEPFLADREKRGVSVQDTRKDGTSLRFFCEVCKDRPVNAYNRGDVTRFLNTLRQVPNTYGLSPKDKGRPISEIIAEAKDKDIERLSEKTVKRHLTALSQFLRFAVDHGHLSHAQRTELVEGHRFQEQRKAKEQRDGWTSEELKILFSSPVWTGCHPRYRTKVGSEIPRDAKFWLPILAVYHGARLEELADLYRRDVWCDDGTWAFRITESEDNGEAGARTLKTQASDRILPLHPELLRLGFLDYVQRTAPEADDPLFPDLKPQGPDKKRGPGITKWFAKYRKAVAIFREGVAMHAFRHTANTRLRDIINGFQQERHVNHMLAWATPSKGEGDRRYDKGPALKACAETLALLRYPEIDLSHLYVTEERR